ncbi:MAG: BrnA antitoxin family protein [Roseicyclus sp.]|nr:BrnA antitoxin family protein [Roseicyclus sp.]
MTTPHWREIIDKTPVQRGRPKVLEPKVSTTIRLDADVVEAFSFTGGIQGLTASFTKVRIRNVSPRDLSAFVGQMILGPLKCLVQV